MNSAEATSAPAKDPVCGMSVDPATAKHKAEHGGMTFFFCSAGCREKFVAEPSNYLAPASAACNAQAARPPGPIYTCPMHPQIRQDHPGACPICGMALEPEVATEATGPERRAHRHDPPLLDRACALRPCLRARNGRTSRRSACASCRKRFPTGFSWRWRRRSRFGRAGRSSSAAGRRSRPAISTCSR